MTFCLSLSTGCTTPDNSGSPSTPPSAGTEDAEEYSTPSIYVYTDNKASIKNKNDYVAASVTIDSYNKSHELFEARANIRLRGNASLNSEKKSYKIKFNEKVNLFNMGSGPAKDWVLIANHCDKTFLRNYLAYEMANRMENLGFNAHCHFAELYVNDIYQGVYVVSESIEVNKNRVDITVDETLETGFLVELDSYNDGTHTFYVRNKWYVIKSDVLTTQQVNAIKKYIEEVDKRILTKNQQQIEEVIDIYSFIDYYIVQEFFKNPDVAWSSCYMYKDKVGKLHMGPVWDFDNAVGNDYRLDGSSYEHLRAGYEEGLQVDNYAVETWFKFLTQTNWFLDLLKERWVEKLPLMNEIIELADEVAEQNIDAIENNYQKWDTLQKRVNVEGAFVFELDTYEKHVDHLQTWLYNRIDWLNDFWDIEIEN